MTAGAGGPAAQHLYDPDWPVRADWLLHQIRHACSGLEGVAGWAYDHIGSTSVPGLAAKPIIDLQLRVPAIPDASRLDTVLRTVDFDFVAVGSRPDSPGVTRDTPRGSRAVPDEVWAKRLYVRDDEQGRAILHVRRADSPWGSYTVWFRDWLRAHPVERDRYARVKQRLAAGHADDADYDDYTRGKTAFFDEVQVRIEAWGCRSPHLSAE